MLKTTFDHIIGQVLRLVEKQITEVGDRGNDVKAILLVGGFGTNRYMHKQLDEAYKTLGIKVLQTNNGYLNHNKPLLLNPADKCRWSAICRGATLWGLEHSQQNPAPSKTVKSRIARYSYGIRASLPFDESKGHLARDRFRDVKGMWRANNQMSWHLRKGERIEEGRQMHQTLTDHVPARVLETGMWSSSSVEELCRVEFGIERSKLCLENCFSDPLTGIIYREVLVDFGIRLDHTTLDFFVKYRDEQVAFTKAKYKEGL
ncbi:hypothetical protein EJ07DRAFT_160131 [Lizonia empirigonia]|nr:hypothetical protein EJ07DRAFT_160131 [Lizonia empirigonia]